MIQKTQRIASELFALCCIFVLLITLISQLCFDRSFFLKEYQIAGTAATLSMSEDDLMMATDTLLDYLNDKRDDILVTAEVNGVKREIFNQRETLHMVDVKNLYQNVLTVRNIMAITALVLFAYLSIHFKNQLSLLAICLKRGLVSMTLILGFGIGLLVVWILADFNSFWTSFHQLFFSNDLWQLNPATSLMINMFPENFFFDMVFRLSAAFILAYLLLFLGLNLFEKLLDKKNK